MENISYIGLSQQIALQQQMNVTANNVANMSTPGFKGQRVLFVDYLNKGKGAQPQDTLQQVVNYASYRTLEQGVLQQTGNPLDVALEGDGYFAVTTPAGRRYTRAGNFTLNANREIVTKNGQPVEGDGGGRLVIPPEATRITITRDGSITTDVGDVGRLKVTHFENEQQLVEQGNNLLRAPADIVERPPEDLRVVQGAVEGSNVNPILEMNRMVEVLRMYQSTHRMLQNDHERIRSTIQKLTRV